MLCVFPFKPCRQQLSIHGGVRRRYVEYGLASKAGISVAALKNNAGTFVTPWQANITRMANDLALPPSAASAQWEHVNFLSLGAPALWLLKPQPLP